MPSLRRRLLFLGVGVVLAVALGVGLFSTYGKKGTQGGDGGVPRPGDPVPSFTLARLGGGAPVSVPADGGGDGRAAVLVFFASWCGPCQKEMPALAHTYAREQSSSSPLARVRILGIDGADPTADALGFVHRSGVTFPVGVDGDYRVTQGRFGFAGLPETVFVTSNGTIAAIHYGGVSAQTVVAWQRRLQRRS